LPPLGALAGEEKERRREEGRHKRVYEKEGRQEKKRVSESISNTE
jgi:hypothetical protein